MSGPAGVRWLTVASSDGVLISVRSGRAAGARRIVRTDELLISAAVPEPLVLASIEVSWDARAEPADRRFFLHPERPIEQYRPLPLLNRRLLQDMLDAERLDEADEAFVEEPGERRVVVTARAPGPSLQTLPFTFGYAPRSPHIHVRPNQYQRR